MQLKYWREKLSGAPPIWSFPLDTPRPPVPTGAGRRVPCVLAPTAVKALRKLATKARSAQCTAHVTATRDAQLAGSSISLPKNS